VYLRVEMVIEIETDSDVWLVLKHAIREAGYSYIIQNSVEHNSLELKPRAKEPEGGQLKHGFIVYDGGCQIGSVVQEVYEQEIKKPGHKPA
jgi:hypothetical protein